MLHAGLRGLHDDGDLTAARLAFDAAYRYAERAGDAGGMGEAALGLGGLWLPAHPGAPEPVLVRMRLRRALAALDPTTVVARRLRTRLVAESDHATGDHAAVLSRLAEARHHRDPIEHAEAAALARNCVAGPDHHLLRASLTGELAEAAARTGRRGDRLLAMLWRTVDRFLDADPRAFSSLADLNDTLAQRPHAAIGAVARSIDVLRRLRAGDLERADVTADGCSGLGLLAGDPNAAEWHLLQTAAVRWYQGRFAELVPTLREWAAGPAHQAVLALGRDGDPTGLRGADLTALPRTDTWLVRMYAIVEAAYLTGDAELASSAYELLTPYGNRPMTAGPAVVCFGSARHALGVAALAAGRIERAVHHLREAVEANTVLGHRPARTLARWRLGEAFERHGDHVRAGHERTLAAAEAAAMGMTLPPRHRRRSAPSRAPARQPVRCCRVGQLWEFGIGPRQVRVPERRGVLYLAMLCTSPGQEIRAAELVAGVRLVDAAGSAQPVLDEAARRDYRRRLASLHGPSDERDWLRAELSAGTGLGGRPRSFRNADERARVSVGKAIRRALDQISVADPLVGARLRDGVHTGVRCSFRE